MKLTRLLLPAVVMLALAGCAAGPKDAAAPPAVSASVSQAVDLPQLAMADGVLYYNTGEESTVEGRCGNMDGELTQQVDAGQFPTEDGQCNFGSGLGYQRFEDHIEILLDHRWMIFAPYEG